MVSQGSPLGSQPCHSGHQTLTPTQRGGGIYWEILNAFPRVRRSQLNFSHPFSHPLRMQALLSWQQFLPNTHPI